MRAATIAGVMMLASASTAGASVLTGSLAVTDANTGASVGYFSNAFDGGGLFVTTQDPTQALQVSIDDAASPSSLLTLNNAGAGSTPYVGGIQGFFASSSNFAADSANYAILAGTTGTVPGASPVLLANTFAAFGNPPVPTNGEAAVWSLSTTGQITAQWVNSDGSRPATSIVLSPDILVPSQYISALTSNPAATEALFPAGTGITADLAFVPTAVPEPSTVLLLGTVLLVAISFGRRRTWQHD